MSLESDYSNKYVMLLMIPRCEQKANIEYVATGLATNSSSNIAIIV